MRNRLPIDDHLESICQGLRENAALVLEAPPGAGKTTVVPLALLHEPWVGHRTILVLEPRRVAAKAAARRMASLLGQEVGHTVGYRVRNETRVGAATRIEVITEGVLTRMLIDDPELSSVAAILFDEFHERSLHADIGLGLALLTQQLLRPDLRLVIMSATLASLPLERIMLDAVQVRSEGRQYPVQTTWLKRRDDRPLPTLVGAAVMDVRAADPDGDILVFLPGMKEIRRCDEHLHAVLRDADVDVQVLHGDLPPEEQDRLLAPRGKGARQRVILTTSIAETSVTIDGVRTVIDAGLARVPRYDARSGMTRLTTVPVSRDAADQRRGRAGRQGPGQCVRLWTEDEDRQYPERRMPEILSADLAPLVVAITAYGVEVHDVPWLDAPPAAALRQAFDLLHLLGACDQDGRLTDHGRRIALLGTHPRLAHMEIVATDHGHGAVARRLRQMLEDRPPRATTAEVHCSGVSPTVVGFCLALAYPDRIAMRKDGTRYLLRNGRTVRLADHDPLAQHPWLAVADVMGSSELMIARAAPLTLEDIRRQCGSHITHEVQAGWDDRTEHLIAAQCERLGALTLQQKPAMDLDAQHLAYALASALAERDYRDLPWTPALEHARNRMNVLRPWTDLLTPESLAPYLHGMKTLRDVRRVPIDRWIQSCLSPQDRHHLDRLAPSHYTTPNGRTVPIDYSDPQRPTISVRLQWMFGVHTTPTIADGRLPLTVVLLSPAQRPIQVTQDLAGFWKGSYQQVRKDMRGRYPKHDWPEDPLSRG